MATVLSPVRLFCLFVSVFAFVPVSPRGLTQHPIAEAGLVAKGRPFSNTEHN